MADFYGDEESIKRVMTLSGLVPDQDLNLQDDDPEEEDAKTSQEKFYDLVEYYFEVAKDYIDHNRKRDFDEDTPVGIKHISERIVTIILGFVVQNQTSPIVQADDFNIQFLEDNILSESVRRQLEDYPSGASEQSGFFAVSISNRNTRAEGDE